MIKIKNSNIQFKVFLGNKNEKTLFAKSIHTSWKVYSFVLEIEEIAKNLLDSLVLGYNYKIVAEAGDKDVIRQDKNHLITFYLAKVVEVERIEQGFICNKKTATDFYVQELGLQNVELEYYPKPRKATSI